VSVFHVIAQLPNGQQKSVFNKTHDETLAIVEEFVHDGTLTTKWGKGTQTRQAYELRIYETANRYGAPILPSGTP
jgi:hypothetical protein